MKRSAPFILMLLGAATVGWALLMMAVFPQAGEVGKLPDGFLQPVVAFEFAQSCEEVALIFLNNAGVTAAMDSGHHLDFAFMALYGSFLFCFCFFHHLQEKSTAFLLGMGLAIVAALSDVMENQQLLILSHNCDAEALGLLPWFVHIKFGSLALYFPALFPLYWRLGWPGKLFSLLAPAALIAFVLCFFLRGLMNEILVLLMALEFFLLSIVSFRLFLQKRLA